MNLVKYKQKNKLIDFTIFINKQYQFISNYTTIIEIKIKTRRKKYVLILPNSVKQFKYTYGIFVKSKYIIYPNSIKNMHMIFQYNKHILKKNILNNIFFCKFYVVDENIFKKNKKHKMHNLFLLENITNITINYNWKTKNTYILKNTQNIKLFVNCFKPTESFLFRNIKYLYMYKYNNCTLCTSNVNILVINNCENMLDVKSFKNIKKIKICLNNSNKEWCNFNAFYFKNIHTVILSCCKNITNICVLKNIHVLVMQNCIEELTYENMKNMTLQNIKNTMSIRIKKYKFIEIVILNEYEYAHAHVQRKKYQTDEMKEMYEIYDDFIYKIFYDNVNLL